MLSLTRGVGEVLVVGENIRITVIAVDQGSVRLGIEAPRDIPIHREEVWVRIRDEDLSSP